MVNLVCYAHSFPFGQFLQVAFDFGHIVTNKSQTMGAHPSTPKSMTIIEGRLLRSITECDRKGVFSIKLLDQSQFFWVRRIFSESRSFSAACSTTKNTKGSRKPLSTNIARPCIPLRNYTALSRLRSINTNKLGSGGRAAIHPSVTPSALAAISASSNVRYSVRPWANSKAIPSTTNPAA